MYALRVLHHVVRVESIYYRELKIGQKYPTSNRHRCCLWIDLMRCLVAELGAKTRQRTWILGDDEFMCCVC